MIYVSTSEAILIKRLDKAVALKSLVCTQITYTIFPLKEWIYKAVYKKRKLSQVILYRLI